MCPGAILRGAVFAAALLLFGRPAGAAEIETEAFAGVGFDGSNHRTPRGDLSASVAAFVRDRWRVELGGRYYFDPQPGEHPYREPRAFASIERLLFASADKEFFLDFILDTDAPSEISGRGFDFSPGLKAEFKVSDDLWAGLAVGTALATAPDPDDRAGFAFADTWVTWDTAWLPNESDSLTLSLYAATDETPGVGNTLRLEVAYSFDLGEHLSATIGGGSELASPYPHTALFFAGGLEWRF